jgi:hypothetical protein
MFLVDKLLYRRRELSLVSPLLTEYLKENVVLSQVLPQL